MKETKIKRDTYLSPLSMCMVTVEVLTKLTGVTII